MFLIFFYVCFFSVFVFYFVYSVFCVLFLLLYIAVSFLFFVQVYRPLPPGGNPTAVNKYRIIHHTYLHWQTCLVRTYTMHRALNAYWYTRA